MPDEFNAVETFNQVTQAAGNFLLIDAATAETLLDSAELASNSSDRSRRIDMAREALMTIDRFIGKLSLEPAQHAEVERVRDRLRARLNLLESENEPVRSTTSGVTASHWPYPEGLPRSTVHTSPVARAMQAD